MDITLNAVQLRKCIEPCNTLVGKLEKGFDLKYCNIQLVITNKILDIYASDTNINIHSTYGEVPDAIQDIDISVPASNFYIIFSDITDSNDVVTLQFKQKFLKVIYKKQQYTLSYFHFSDLIKEKVSIFDEPDAFRLFNNIMFEDINKNTYYALFKCKYSDLKTIFNNLIPCMSKSPAESHIYGIYYDGNFYASNGSSFTGCYEINNNFECGETTHIFFQKPIIDFLSKISLDDDCTIGLRGNMVSINIGIFHIVFRNNMVKYVPVKVLKSFIEKNDKKCTVKTKELAPLIKKIKPFADFINKCYGEIIFNKTGDLSISVQDSNRKSSFVEYIPDNCEPVDVITEVGIMLDTIQDALESINTENTIIHYNSKDRLPLIFVNELATQYYYISPTKLGVREEKASV